MARIRSIKPSFFRSDDVVAIPHAARLTWLGLWVYGDDNGRSIDDPRLIKIDIWPLEDAVTIDHVREHIDTLEALGRIRRYEVGGKRYLEVVNFNKHQVIKTPSKTGHPAPLWNLSPSTGTALTQPSPSAVPPLKTEVEVEVGSGTGNGGGGSSRFCPRHPNGTDDPCRACQTAREAFEAARKPQGPSVPLPPRVTDRHGFCEQHGDYPLPCDRCALEAQERRSA